MQSDDQGYSSGQACDEGKTRGRFAGSSKGKGQLSEGSTSDDDPDRRCRQAEQGIGLSWGLVSTSSAGLLTLCNSEFAIPQQYKHHNYYSSRTSTSSTYNMLEGQSSRSGSTLRPAFNRYCLAVRVKRPVRKVRSLQKLVELPARFIM